MKIRIEYEFDPNIQNSCVAWEILPGGKRGLCEVSTTFAEARKNLIKEIKERPQETIPPEPEEIEI